MGCALVLDSLTTEQLNALLQSSSDKVKEQVSACVCVCVCVACRFGALALSWLAIESHVSLDYLVAGKHCW